MGRPGEVMRIPTSVFSISGNAGLVSNAGSTTYSAVLGPTASNAEVYATFSMSSFASSNVGGVLRWTDGNNWYKGYIDGSNLLIQKKVNAGRATITHKCAIYRDRWCLLHYPFPCGGFDSDSQCVGVFGF